MFFTPRVLLSEAVLYWLGFVGPDGTFIGVMSDAHQAIHTVCFCCLFWELPADRTVASTVGNDQLRTSFLIAVIGYNVTGRDERAALR